MLSRGAMTREDIRVLTDDEIECFNDCSYDIFITTVSRVFDYFERRTCNKCKYFGSNEDTWNQDECPMHMIGDSAKEYCWKWKTNETI